MLTKTWVQIIHWSALYTAKYSVTLDPVLTHSLSLIQKGDYDLDTWVFLPISHMSVVSTSPQISCIKYRNSLMR